MRTPFRNATESAMGLLRPSAILLILVAGLMIQSCDIFSGSGSVNYDVSVTVDPTGAGSITPTADSTYARGDSLTLTAVPAEGYAFSKWTSDLNTADNPLKLEVTEDLALTALFVKKNYELIVNTEGGGQVMQQVMDADTSSYDHGTIVHLTAAADFDYNFDSWEGDVDSTDGNKAWVTVQSPKEVTAVFVKRTFSLTVNTQGQGSVTADPDESEYVAGTEVDLTAEADQNWSFERWTGDVDETDNPLTVTVDSNMTVEAVFANDDFEGGNGTEDNPFQVSTLDQLQLINSYTDSHFELINDIDATPTSAWNAGSGFRPLGDDVVQFTGSFNGQGYTISNLFIDRGGQTDVGLFGYVSGGAIRNLVIETADVTGGSHTGVLAGYLDGTAVDSVTASGTVVGADYTGGLIGRILEEEGEAQVTDAGAGVTVTGASYTGGLIGENAAAVLRSYATSNVTGTGTDTGGLLGTHNGTLDESYASGNVTGDEKVGGLAGVAAPQSEIVNSYALGAVSGNDTVGGLAGAVNSDSRISLSFAAGTVTGNFDVGGFAGANAGTVENGYWDEENSGQSSGVGIGSDSGTTGLTTDAMQGPSAEDEMDALDFADIWVTVTNDYPMLHWQQGP
ncbi:MAG: hypothetical protein U5K31_06340 [Balneolaceae bacterium]|nr:hypothetical protein [Balneolaceae bacterium]